MYTRGEGLFALAAAVFLALALAACRTPVPEPSMEAGKPGHPPGRMALTNIGPQGVPSAVAVTAADINGDGHMDLVLGMGRDRAGFLLALGDGRGHWRAVPAATSAIEARNLTVADIDHDKRPEVLIVGTGARKGMELWTYMGEEEGWRLHSVPTDVGVYTAAALVDVNEDALIDIVAASGANEGRGGVDVWLNNGRGGWVGGFGPEGQGRFTDVAVADLDGDGHMDIVASRRGGMGALTPLRRRWMNTGGVNIWYGDGNARWQAQPMAGEGDAEAVALSDVDGDGRTDVIAGFYRLGIRVWLNQGGSRWRYQTVTDQGSWGDIAAADIDGDGQRELVAASRDGHGLGVWSWFRTGFLPRRGLVPDNGIYLGLDVADIQDGGDLSIIAVTDLGRIEAWSDTAASPLQKGRSMPEEAASLSIPFAPAAAQLSDDVVEAMHLWWRQSDAGGKPWQFRIRAGRGQPADLSEKRMQTVAQWLLDQGVKPQQITRWANTQKQAGGEDTLELSAVALPEARLPMGEIGEIKRQDLFHIEANKVFKTIDGLAEYRVGVKDQLSITFWRGGKPEEHKVDVQIDGTVSLPYQEALHVQGLTPREIDTKITQLLSRFELHPRVDVRVLKAQSKSASIFGEVRSLTRQPTGPGTYFLDGKETLVDFLSRVGGPGKDADLTRVQVIRGGKTIILNLDRAIMQGDFTQNAILDEGDTIFIPSTLESKHQVYVLGDGIKPGIVEFKGDTIHLLDVVLKSGGFKPEAYLPDIRVVRADQDKPLILAAAFDRFVEKGDLTQNLILKDKDIIIVPAEPIANWNRMIGKLMPTLNAALTTGTTIEEVLRVRDILRGVSVSGGGVFVGVGGG